MQPFNCLTDPIEGKFFLEASAGTGKTFAIEHIVARHLAAGRSLREILLVTFTRAATRDLRARILANLEAADHREAIAQFDEAQIYTIHGFCHAMLQEYALEADVGLEMESPDEQSYLALVDEVIADCFRAPLPDFDPAQLALMLGACRGQFATLVQRVRHLAFSREKRELPRSWPEIAALCPKEDVRELFFANASSFKGLCNVRKEPHDKFVQQVEKLACGDPSFLLDKELFLAYITEEGRKKSVAGAPMPEPLVALRDILLPLWQEATDARGLMARIAALCRPRIAARLQESELVSPDMLLELMREALQKPAFFNLVQERYSVALIDEFQDTDPLQWDIFKALFLDDPKKTLFLVGDPKQSIYAFRGADVGTYLRAKEEMGKECAFSLSTNYRSEPRLIGDLNRLFSETAWLGDIDYTPVLASPEAKDSSATTGLHVALFDGREEEVLFPYIAAEIAKKEVPLSRIALLIRDKFQAGRLQAYFERLSLPAQAKGVVHIAETRMFFAMELFLRVLLVPSDRSAMKQLLATPLARYSHWQLRGDLSEEFAALATCAQVMEERGFSAAFSHLLDTTLGREKVLHHLALDLADYGDWMQLGELLIERALGRIDTADALLHALAEIEGTTVDESPEYKRRSLSSDEAVIIMTTHMSKGLEFDTVFAIGMATGSTHEEEVDEQMRQFYVAMTRAKRRVYLPLPIGPKGENAPATRFMKKLLGENCTEEAALEKLGSLEISCEKIVETPAPSFAAAEAPTLHPPRELPPLAKQSFLSFSSLAEHGPEVERPPLAEGGLPLGAETGIRLHAIMEKVIDRGFTSRHRVVLSEVAGTPLAPYKEEIIQMVEGVFAVDFGGFTLHDVAPQQMVTESEFRFPLGKSSVMKGFADLLFFHCGKYYLVDWKSNFLGNTPDEYARDALEAEMTRRDYFLQAEIYSEALRKYLKVIEAKPYEEIFGGAFYLFLRAMQWKGVGSYSFIPQDKGVYARIS